MHKSIFITISIGAFGVSSACADPVYLDQDRYVKIVHSDEGSGDPDFFEQHAPNFDTFDAQRKRESIGLDLGSAPELGRDFQADIITESTQVSHLLDDLVFAEGFTRALLTMETTTFGILAPAHAETLFDVTFELNEATPFILDLTMTGTQGTDFDFFFEQVGGDDVVAPFSADGTSATDFNLSTSGDLAPGTYRIRQFAHSFSAFGNIADHRNIDPNTGEFEFALQLRSFDPEPQPIPLPAAAWTGLSALLPALAVLHRSSRRSRA